MGKCELREWARRSKTPALADTRQITGEIVVSDVSSGKQKALPIGAYAAVGIVTCSYMLVALSYVSAYSRFRQLQ